MQTPPRDGLAVQQLTPELMEPISHAMSVIFIDAKAGGQPGAIEERTLFPAPVTGPFTGSDFEIGHPLSESVQLALKTLLKVRGVW